MSISAVLDGVTYNDVTSITASDGTSTKTITLSESGGGGSSAISTGSFTITAEEIASLSGYYTVDSITCSYFIITARRETGAGGYLWVYTPYAKCFSYSNPTNLTLWSSSATNIRTASTYCSIVDGHPAIKALSSDTFPLYPDTYDIIYW